MNCPRCNSPASEETLREFGGVCPKCLLHFAEEKDAPAFPSLEIVEMIGQGGMGVVYKAVQKSLNRTVALKVLSPTLSTDPEFVERFTREAKALAQLNHPNIVGIYDSGIHDKVPYLVMEYVEGKSLRQLLASKELTASQALELVPQICDALYYAHAKGVVHRDIKPENILVDPAGRVKIADYGLAKIAAIDQPRITKSNIAMGTPHYMAPEQIERTSEVDHRADIYSLGVVIYEMLTGELPLGRFKAPSERAEVDRRLDHVVLKSLEREPADRYQSANEMKAQITHLERAPAPAQRLSKMAVASGIICLHGVASLTLAVILMTVDHVMAANVFAGLGGMLLLASLGFSIPSVVLILSSRGALRGLWIPVTSGLASALILLVGLLGMVPGVAAAPRQVVTSAFAPPDAKEYHLTKGWPEPYVLTPSFQFEEKCVGDKAVLAARLAGKLPGDATLIQYGRFSPGGSELVFIKFKSADLRTQWKQAPELSMGENQWIRIDDAGNEGLWLQRRGSLPLGDQRLDRIWEGIYAWSFRIPDEEWKGHERK